MKHKILIISMALLMFFLTACSSTTGSSEASTDTTGTTTSSLTLSFSTDFESDTLGSTLPTGFYSGSFADATVVSSNDGYPAHGGAQSIQLGDTSASSNSKLVRILDGGSSTSTATLYTAGRIKFYAYLDAECGVQNNSNTAEDETQENLYLTLYNNGTSSGNRVIDIRLEASTLKLQHRTGAPTGDLTYVDETNAVFNLENWNEIQIEWDDSQYYITFNGTQYGPYDLLQTGGVGNAYFKFGQSGLVTTAKAYVDDIEIYN
ncbi:hypothetical protein WKV44_07800 [Spirochaetia bacterium 38H-sp]|uniref:Alginate lyase n=1 Tax=Rarispira pelagica TaxID=3141764 RepID=A0ABU9UCQ1_9SPIR